jgi:hypothetical protein
MNDLMALVAIFTGLCLVIGIAGWASDCWLDRKKDVLPPPQERAVSGQSHKAWM